VSLFPFSAVEATLFRYFFLQRPYECKSRLHLSATLVQLDEEMYSSVAHFTPGHRRPDSWKKQPKRESSGRKSSRRRKNRRLDRRDAGDLGSAMVHHARAAAD